MKLFQVLTVAAAASATTVLSQSRPAMMKAIVAHTYGGPEVLKLEEIPRPEPKEGEMLVKVMAAGVNPVDGEIRSGKYAQFFKSKLPLVPGYDIAGTVEKAGPDSSKFKTGDAIYAYIPIPEGGGYAEYAIATEKQAAPKPQTITFAEAAAVPVVALTAWQALIDTAHLEAGQTALIHGGSGGVGTLRSKSRRRAGPELSPQLPP